MLATIPRHVLIAALALIFATLSASSALARCDLSSAPPCHGCGCKGGPGWRHIASNRCVGFRDIDQKCGRPPSRQLCVFENAPGTGANHDCALEPATPPAALKR